MIFIRLRIECELSISVCNINLHKSFHRIQYFDIEYLKLPWKIAYEAFPSKFKLMNIAIVTSLNRRIHSILSIYQRFYFCVLHATGHNFQLPAGVLFLNRKKILLFLLRRCWPDFSFQIFEIMTDRHELVKTNKKIFETFYVIFFCLFIISFHFIYFVTFILWTFIRCERSQLM